MERAKRARGERARGGEGVRGRGCVSDERRRRRNDKAEGRTVSLAHLRLLPVDDDSEDSRRKLQRRRIRRRGFEGGGPVGVDVHHAVAHPRRPRVVVRDTGGSGHGSGAGGASQRGNVDPDEIDDVVIVGGSSRLAVIRQRLSEAFHGGDVHHTVNPDTAMAVGAARSYAC